MEQQGIAGPHTQPMIIEDLLHALGADHLAGGESARAVELGDVDQQAACHQLWQRVDTQPVGAILLDDLVEVPSVVDLVADLQVVEGIDVRPHLLGRLDLLDDPVDVVLPPAALAGVGAAPVQLVGRRHQHLLERAPRERRDAVVDDVGEVEDLPGAHQPGGLCHALRRRLVERAGLIAGAVSRGFDVAQHDRTHSDDHVLSKSAYRVRPPSTNNVCPVT